MTFLEFACHEELGPPAHGASWHCPCCDPGQDEEWVSFSVRPPKASYPIKFKCHRCQWWGDEHDLLLVLYPGEENRDVRRLRLAELKRMYLRDHRPRPPLGDIQKLLDKVSRRQDSTNGAAATSQPTIAQRGTNPTGNEEEDQQCPP